MSFVAVAGAAIGAAGGIAKAIAGNKAKKEAAAEKAAAQSELEAQKAQYAAMDTSNPFANMQSTMEDVTVNKQQAEFEQQMAQQQQANIMQGMRGAAGGSGVAALAQTMASQGALQAQKAGASIGQQEQSLQLERAKEASRIQEKELGGELASRQAKKDVASTMMGMQAADVEAAAASEQAGQEQMWSGITGAAGAVGGAMGGMGGGGG